MPTISAHTGPFGQLFFEEPEVARYIAIPGTADGFQLPTSERSDHHIQEIHAPGVLSTAATVIYFRTRHKGQPSVSVRLNSTSVTRYTFTSDDPHERSWHEIIAPGVLKPQDNELTFNASGEGNVVFGDVVVLYTSNEITVRKQLVFSPQRENVS